MNWKKTLSFEKHSTLHMKNILLEYPWVLLKYLILGNYLFHGGGPYHIEISPQINGLVSILYGRDLCHERDNALQN